jgi:protein TonB
MVPSGTRATSSVSELSSAIESGAREGTMVARIPVGLSASAVFHAAVVALLVLLPVLGGAPFPDTHVTQPDILRIPIAPQPHPVSATSVRPPAGRMRRASSSVVALPAVHVVPAVPQAEGEPIENPSDSTLTCLGCVTDGPGPGEAPVGTDASDSDGTASGPAAPIRVGSGVEPPRKLVHVAPRYPELAQRAGLEGTVELECVIDPSGAVAAIEVASGPALLRAAAVDAVRQWRYTPTKLNGIPVSVVMTVTVRFSLRRGI